MCGRVRCKRGFFFVFFFFFLAAREGFYKCVLSRTMHDNVASRNTHLEKKKIMLTLRCRVVLYYSGNQSGCLAVLWEFGPIIHHTTPLIGSDKSATLARTGMESEGVTNHKSATHHPVSVWSISMVPDQSGVVWFTGSQVKVRAASKCKCYYLHALCLRSNYL
jgi:hypothetical protein